MPTAQPLRTGDPQRLGEYELSGRLGEGGQGTVFLGSTSGDTYAVKLLHGPVGDERAAFLREVELAKHVARFCTAQVIDAGFDEGRPYIVSEYVDGPSLQREVALTGPRRGGALERLAVSTATALAAIHRAGIVHRDFKPQNVLLGSDGPRVIDFGLARALDAAATVSGRGVGTPAYMAPEQITASAVTGAADVFSWGATMCFAANATAPFGQDSVAPVLHRILTAQPELGRLDGRLRTLVDACLDKNSRNRPTSRDLLLALLGDRDDVPEEVLRSPPAHILRVTPPLVPEPRPPLADPEATGAPGGYLLPGSGAQVFGAQEPDGQAPDGRMPDGQVSDGQAPDGQVSGAAGAGQDAGWRGGQAGPSRTGWLRAAVAVCVALLVSAAVLIAVLYSALNGDSGQTSQAAGPSVPAPSSSRPAASQPTPAKSSPAKSQPTAAGRKPTADPPVAMPVTVPIPPLAGMGREAAAKAIKRAGLVPGAVSELDSAQKIGLVLGSRPAAGSVVAKGTKVSLQVSAGLPVPSVVGLQRKAAAAVLTRTGLTVGAVTRSCSEQPEGQVLSTQPKAGRRVQGSASVALTVARAGTVVPSVAGQTRADARAALVGAGFVVRSTGQVVEDPARVGTVLSQSLQAGTCAAAGSTVTLVVGRAGQSGPDPDETTPTPTTSTGPIAGD
ncbi:protein kinase domain-containing protein [Nonomuraea sp. NPDC002799]